jgi:membrane-associated phospholipid phosphatase
MDRMAHPQQVQPSMKNGHKQKIPHFGVDIAIWLAGLIVLVVLAVIVHIHKAPFPFELAFTKDIQGPHPNPCVAPPPKTWIDTLIFMVSDLNAPRISIIDGGIWTVIMLFLRWWRQVIFFIVSVATGGLWFLILTPIVARPRPSVSEGICVQTTVHYFSFPSGHVIHDVVTYGFLLYFSFSKPVRQWRYRWVLLPLQYLAILEIMTIGFSRVLEGEHMLLDVVGGYLVGFLWLFLFIYLYIRASAYLEQHPIHWKRK